MTQDSEINSKRVLVDVFRAVYVGHINRMIDESRYIRTLQVVSERGFKTYHLENFDKLALHLRKIGMMKSYVISVLFYFRDENFRVIGQVARYFDTIHQMLNLRLDILERMKMIDIELERKLMIARAFLKNDKTYAITHPGMIMPNAKIDGQLIIAEWLVHNRQDIMNRLHQLVECFTLDQLHFMGVQVLKISVIMSMDNNALQMYYDSTIETVIRCIIVWRKTCALFADADRSYRRTCMQINNGVVPQLQLDTHRVKIIRRRDIKPSMSSTKILKRRPIKIETKKVESIRVRAKSGMAVASSGPIPVSVSVPSPVQTLIDDKLQAILKN